MKSDLIETQTKIQCEDKWLMFSDSWDVLSKGNGASFRRISALSCVRFNCDGMIDGLTFNSGFKEKQIVVKDLSSFTEDKFICKDIADFQARSLSELLVKLDLEHGLFDEPSMLA